MNTPLTELIKKLQEIYDVNPLEPDYREGIADAISQAKVLLSTERSHILNAWQDGSEGILNQSANSYYREVYGK